MTLGCSCKEANSDDRRLLGVKLLASGDQPTVTGDRNPAFADLHAIEIPNRRRNGGDLRSKTQKSCGAFNISSARANAGEFIAASPRPAAASRSTPHPQ